MIYVKNSNTEIAFIVPSDIFKQTKDWEYTQDRNVFEEQLATGSFKGKYPVKNYMIEIMKIAQQQGKIMPYYGAGGSSGACFYLFRFLTNKCRFQVTHSVTKKSLWFYLKFEILPPSIKIERKPEMQFSFLPYFTDEKLENPWNGERHKVLVCKIFDQEYENLKKWKYWKNTEALTTRYIYRFAQVSMSATGFSIKVRDTDTGNKIDITDYDNW
ncbi:MAG: hypothetical protein EAZ76_06785 [Nostocales cyanobacterium]|nr:MAG: hypothetical protein EAZ87_18410 [Nostocales cyanobacterium]TAF16785.1 MAG: hypothetical protein EAZ76_06785 [Nostocales cyanobacterium]